MAFFKFRNRNKSSPSVVISNPIPVVAPEDSPKSQQQHYGKQQKPPRSSDPQNKQIPEPQQQQMDYTTRPTAIKLRGGYFSINNGSPRKKPVPTPLPPLPTYRDFGLNDSPSSHSNSMNGERGYARGISSFDRQRTSSEETMQMLSSPGRTPTTNPRTPETDIPTDLAPISTSPPKLKLSFESNITEAGSVYDLDTPPNHRVSLSSSSNRYPTFNGRHSPERIITAPIPPVHRIISTSEASESPVRNRPASSSNTPRLRRTSAVYAKRRPSLDVAGGGTGASIKSDKSTGDSSDGHDSGFHEEFDEALRSKQPSPQTSDVSGNSVETGSTHLRTQTASPSQTTPAVTPERAPLLSDGRFTPITLTDPGVTTKPTTYSLPEIEKMETFKETFSTNLFENTLPPEPKRTVLLSPKPISTKTLATPRVTPKGKVISAAEFEKLRQQADNDSDDEEEEEDLARDEIYEADVAKQRRRQQAALSIYRQQMTKIVGAAPTPELAPPPRPMSQVSFQNTGEDESEEIPLGILMAHGFPQTNNRPSTAQGRLRTASMESNIRTPSPGNLGMPNVNMNQGNLPVFARQLPIDPHVRALPRSTSEFDLRPAYRASMQFPRTNSTSSVPLLNMYQTNGNKGASFMDPRMEQQPQSPMLPPEQSYFNQMPVQYETMGMQAVPGVAPGMIQYVPVVVSPPMSSHGFQQPTLMQELQERQQFGAQQRQFVRMSQYVQQQPGMYAPPPPTAISPPAPPPHQTPMVARPPSMYHDPRRSFYDAKSIYSTTSQSPTARPKLPSTNPAYRLSTATTNTRYRAYSNAAPKATPSRVNLNDDDDADWDALRRKKEEMQARRLTRLSTAA